MTLEQLEADYKAMGETIAKMKEEAKAKVINYWQPKNGENYYYVSVDGNTYSSERCINSLRYRIFKTKEEAEAYAEYVKAEETLKEAIATANEGWLPDFSDDEQNKYYIFKTRERLDWIYCNYDKDLPTFMYIKSQELAMKLMKEYEAEFLVYLSY